jgi:excisionase family DNA binding protein
LGLTPRTLYRLIDLGQLPAYRFGRVIRLQCGEVEDYIVACRVVPGTLGHLHNYPGGSDPDDEEPPAEE